MLKKEKKMQLSNYPVLHLKFPIKFNFFLFHLLPVLFKCSLINLKRLFLRFQLRVFFKILAITTLDFNLIPAKPLKKVCILGPGQITPGSYSFWTLGHGVLNVFFHALPGLASFCLGVHETKFSIPISVQIVLKSLSLSGLIRAKISKFSPAQKFLQKKHRF